MPHPDTPYYDEWLDPHTVAVVHALLRVSLATATMHLDLEEHDEFYNRLRHALSHWQQEPLRLPEPMTLDPDQTVSALAILAALEVFLVPLPPDYLVDVDLIDP